VSLLYTGSFIMKKKYIIIAATCFVTTGLFPTRGNNNICTNATTTMERMKCEATGVAGETMTGAIQAGQERLGFGQEPYGDYDEEDTFYTQEPTSRGQTAFQNRGNQRNNYGYGNEEEMFYSQEPTSYGRQTSAGKNTGRGGQTTQAGRKTTQGMSRGTTSSRGTGRNTGGRQTYANQGQGRAPSRGYTGDNGSNIGQRSGTFENIGEAVGGIADNRSSKDSNYGKMGKIAGSLLDFGLGFLNATGEAHYFDENTIPIAADNFGQIDQKMTVSVDLPAINEKMLYTFTPTEGQDAGMMVQVLFASYSTMQPAPEGTPASIAYRIDRYMNICTASDIDAPYKSLVLVFRRVQGTTLWSETVSATLETNDPSSLSITAEISPDAEVDVPALQQLGTMDFAKMPEG
jgi:hypothetical protein